MLPPGLVQSRSSVCLGRVLCPLRRSRLPSAFMLPERSSGEGGEWSHDWPYLAALQLCLLCLPCPWKQVQITLLACPMSISFPHVQNYPWMLKLKKVKTSFGIIKTEVGAGKWWQASDQQASPHIWEHIWCKYDTSTPLFMLFNCILRLVFSCMSIGFHCACSLFIFLFSFFLDNPFTLFISTKMTLLHCSPNPAIPQNHA